jgi:uncharacterized membrane protein YeiH
VFELLSWLGTMTFAVAGALVAIEKRFDLIGTLVLASVTAVGGGAIRDIIVGILPPSSFSNEPLLWVVALSALLTFYLHRIVSFESRALYLLDTLGLAIFAALGAERGVTFGLGMWGTLFAGAVSGVGGGVLRDVLSGQVPGILYRSGDFYASAAALGALVVFWLYPLEPSLATVAGVVVTVALRLGSRLMKLELPVPRDLPHEQ